MNVFYLLLTTSAFVGVLHQQILLEGWSLAVCEEHKQRRLKLFGTFSFKCNSSWKLQTG